MNNPNWLDKIKALWATLNATNSEWPDPPTTPWRTAGPWSGLVGRQPQMMEVEEEVAAEQRGRLLLISRDAELGPLLLTCLRQQAPLPTTETIRREGFFTLFTLPATPTTPTAEEQPVPDLASEFTYPYYQPNWEISGWGAPHNGDLLWEAATGADLVLYLVQPATGWQPEDAHWFARLRALAIPILPLILSEVTEVAPVQTPPTLLDAIRRSTGIRPVSLAIQPPSAGELAAAALPDLLDLLKRILDLRPRLALPLAQEAPCYRPFIAERIIRTGAFMTALVGSEPIPLLDVPLQVALQWKVALQLAAIYGRPGLDYRSREMLGTVLVNLGVRYVAQGILKLVPFIGWLLSAILSGVSTWLLGHALYRYYEQDQVWVLPAGVTDQWQRTIARAQAAQRQWDPARAAQITLSQKF